MKLLFITQKLHGQDAFGALWVKGFLEKGYDVRIVCLESRPEQIHQLLGMQHLPPLEIHSMGKERDISKIAQILHFWKLMCSLDYDRVFIHMSPVWGLLGAPIFIARRTPVYLWYTHYKMQAGLWLLGRYAKRMFCATAQSLPQYEGSPKKIVTGHGIDMSYWPKRENHTTDGKRLLGVFRLSRSKRLEICIRAMTVLPDSYTWDTYGIEAEPAYVQELKNLIADLDLSDRIHFHGTAAAHLLPDLYASHRLILNMASETIDKTMLEAMTCGCYPVTTARNAAAIGIPSAPEADTPEAVAAFIARYKGHTPIDADTMYGIVAERHSLTSLIEKMDAYIRPGL